MPLLLTPWAAFKRGQIFTLGVLQAREFRGHL